MRCEIRQKPRTASKCVAKYAKSLEQRPNALRKILKTLMDGVKSAGAFKCVQMVSKCISNCGKFCVVSDLPRSNVFERTSKPLNDAKKPRSNSFRISSKTLYDAGLARQLRFKRRRKPKNGVKCVPKGRQKLRMAPGVRQVSHKRLI